LEFWKQFPKALGFEMTGRREGGDTHYSALFLGRDNLSISKSLLDNDIIFLFQKEVLYKILEIQDSHIFTPPSLGYRYFTWIFKFN